MARVEDNGRFYRLPSDNRDLNYNMYFSEGKKNKKIFEYNSHNTKQLNDKQVINLLKNNPSIKGS